jgi:hypothetical protein
MSINYTIPYICLGFLHGIEFISEIFPKNIDQLLTVQFLTQFPKIQYF